MENISIINRKIRSICPECNKEIQGEIYEKNGRILLKKTCPEHGDFQDMLSSNPDLFKDKMSLLDHAHPNPCNMLKCRDGIFKCPDHIGRKSPLAFIEITTKCNMRCPICYADAASKGCDMPINDVFRIIDTISAEDPNTHIVLIGGEPTIHKDFFKILEKIKNNDLMKRTFIATNGITLANKDFCEKVQKTGIKKFYLGFDGTDREACKKIRGSYIAYDSVREALKNIRKGGKAWIILSITAVKDLNIDNIPDTIRFAMDNSDIVKRIMISPEVYCGRVSKNESLADTRITGDCIEDFLRKQLNVKVASVSISLFFSLLRPLKSAGILDPNNWMAAMPSPFCGQMGLLWIDKRGKFHSIIDTLIRSADKKIYELGRKANNIANGINSKKGSLRSYALGRILWKLYTFLFAMPKYVFILLSYANCINIFNMLAGIIRSGFNIKQFKKHYFNKKVELYYLMCSDKYNFIWDKMPYCLTHHYRIHPETKDVIKVPGCSILPFREAHE